MRDCEIKDYFESFLNRIVEEEDFWKYYFQNPCYLEDIEVRSPNGYHIGTGACRLCLIPDDFPYVLKVDYGKSDCCEREVDIYNEAVERGVDFAFSGVKYLGTFTKTFEFFTDEEIDDVYEPCYFAESLAKCEDLQTITISIPMYVYEKCEEFYYKKSTLTPEMREFVSESCSPLAEYSDIGINFLEEYGKDIFDEITDFLEEMEINDLHFGNMGYLGGKVVILDYAGYSCY